MLIFYFLSLTAVVFRSKLTGTCQIRCGTWEIEIVKYGQSLYIFLHLKLQNNSAFYIKKLKFREMKLHSIRKLGRGRGQDSKVSLTSKTSPVCPLAFNDRSVTQEINFIRRNTTNCTRDFVFKSRKMSFP